MKAQGSPQDPAEASSGSQNGTPWVDEDPTPKSKGEALGFLRIGGDITDTIAETYLTVDRRIDKPHPADFKHVENARTGEGALLAPLYANGQVVAVQLIYIDRNGRKSTIKPVKQRLSIERAPSAVFCLPYDGDSTDVVTCDGLEDALSVWRYGAQRCRVIGLPGIGALRHQKFPEGTKVTVVADGDRPGSKGAELLQRGLDALLLQGCDVLVTAIPPEGWDANRFLVEHGVEALRVFLASAQPAKLSDNGEIRRLAKLDLLSYGRERKQVAEHLGITVGILDKLVEKQRRKLAEEAKAEAEDWVSVDDTRPWSDEVDGVELLDALAKTISSFVVMTKEKCWAIALWVVFTWCFDVAHCALKLWIESAEARSGKTRLVEVLSYLVCRVLVASGMSVAAFYRLIEMKRPTLLMDEFDSWAAGNEEFRGVLNAGFDKRNAVRWVCVGEDNIPTPFSLWCPQVIAGIGSIPVTVADRCLKITLMRKLRSQTVEKLRRRGAGALDELAQKCARWATDNIGDLVNAEPEVPESINDRAADGWELLLAIADQVGGHWPERARQAAIRLSGDGEHSVDDESIGIQLLKDIRAVLNEHPPIGDTSEARDKVPSANLVAWLVALEDRPWIEFTRGQPMTQHQLARQLRKYQLSPTAKRGDGAQSRGYSRAAFKEVIDRYLMSPPPGDDKPQPGGKPNGHYGAFSFAGADSPIQSVTPSQLEDSCGFPDDFKVSREDRCDTLKKPQNPSETAASDSVTLQNGKIGPSNEKGPSNGLDDGHESAATSDPEPSSVADEARRLKQQNPSWSIKRIAAELGQPEARIARYFAH
jgi:hypothetical protein